MMRVFATAFCVLVVAFAGCTRVGTSKENVANQAATGRTLQVGAAIAPNSFNPLLSTESLENMLDRLIYDQLVVIDNTGTAQPDLAVQVPSLQNGGISRDGLTITYKLRKGIRWQDGAPFTSDDVRFSFNQVMNPHNNVSSRVGYEMVQRVDTPDRFTVAFHLRKPYAPIVTTLFSSANSPNFVVPAHLLRSYAELNSVPFNSRPVGTGPYQMAKWLRGDHIEFVANPNYFLGRPKILKIVVHFIPDENTAVNEMRTHELDWFYAASETSYSQLKTIPGVRNVISPQNSYRGMLINTESPLVGDVRVRRAIAYAIDKESIVQKVTYGAAHAATADIPSSLWAYDRDVPVYRYNPAKAKQLLAQAGWMPGPGGVLHKAGTPLELRFVLRQGAATDTRMSVAIQSQLRAVGIDPLIKTYQGSMLFGGGTSGVLSGGHYDIDLNGFGSGFDPDNSAQFTCNARPPNGFNWSRYCTSEMDVAQGQAVSSYDRTVRKTAYAKIETLLARDVPQIFMYWQPEIDAVNPALKNFTGGPFFPNWNAYQWEL